MICCIFDRDYSFIAGYDSLEGIDGNLVGKYIFSVQPVEYKFNIPDDTSGFEIDNRVKIWSGID